MTHQALADSDLSAAKLPAQQGPSDASGTWQCSCLMLSREDNHSPFLLSHVQQQGDDIVGMPLHYQKEIFQQHDRADSTKIQRTIMAVESLQTARMRASGQPSNHAAEAQPPPGDLPGSPGSPAYISAADPPPTKASQPSAAEGSGAPGSEGGSANVRGLRIRTLDLGATAAADAAHNSSNAEAPARVNNGSASDTASPLSHGSLNAFNPFEGGSEFMLSPLRRGGDNQGDIAGAEGSPPAHRGFSPFGLVAELRFTPTPPLDMGAPLETGAAE